MKGNLTKLVTLFAIARRVTRVGKESALGGVRLARVSPPSHPCLSSPLPAVCSLSLLSITQIADGGVAWRDDVSSEWPFAPHSRRAGTGGGGLAGDSERLARAADRAPIEEEEEYHSSECVIDVFCQGRQVKDIP